MLVETSDKRATPAKLAITTTYAAFAPPEYAGSEIKNEICMYCKVGRGTRPSGCGAPTRNKPKSYENIGKHSRRNPQAGKPDRNRSKAQRLYPATARRELDWPAPRGWLASNRCPPARGRGRGGKGSQRLEWRQDAHREDRKTREQSVMGMRKSQLRLRT